MKDAPQSLAGQTEGREERPTILPDTLELSRSDGGVANTEITDWQPTEDGLIEALSKATVGSKDGSYFVRGPTDTGSRCDAGMPHATVLIIDGDKQITEDGEIIDGCIHPSLAHEALTELGIRHFIYTSHSHDPDKQFFKWRAVIPCLMINGDELHAMSNWIIEQLREKNCRVCLVSEMTAWSQPWFFPRIRDKGAEFLTFDGFLDGLEPIGRDQVKAITEEWDSRKPEGGKAFDGRSSVKNANSPIGRFNAQHDDPEKWRELLERHGFQLISTDKVNGSIAWRYLPPDSTTKQAGVHVYRGKHDGALLITSHNGSFQLPRTVCDFFGLWTHLEHAGDTKAAEEAIGIKPKKPAPKTPAPARDETSPSDLEMGAEPPASKPIEAFKFPDPFKGFMAHVVDSAVLAANRPQPNLTTLACLIGMAGALGGEFHYPDGTRLNLYGIGIAESGDGKDLPLRLASMVTESASAEVIGRPASGQGLEDSLIDDRGMLCPLDEIGHLLRNMADSKSPSYLVELASNFLQLFSGSMRGSYRCRVRAKAKGTPLSRTLQHPCLSLLGFTTPSSLSSGLNLQSIESGLLGRLLFVEGLAGVRPRITTKKLFIPEVAGHDIHQANQSGRNFVLSQTAEATDLFARTMDGFFEAEKAAPTPEGRALLRRSFEKVRRISGVLAVWDCPSSPQVSVDHIEWATQLVRASDSALLQFAADRIHESDDLADAAKVLSVIDRIGNGDIKPRDSSQACILKLKKRYAPRTLALKASKLSKKKFDDAVHHLQATDEVQEGEIETGTGRKSKILYRI